MIPAVILPLTYLDALACLSGDGGSLGTVAPEHDPASRCTCMLVRGREFKSPSGHLFESLTCGYSHSSMYLPRLEPSHGLRGSHAG